MRIKTNQTARRRFEPFAVMGAIAVCAIALWPILHHDEVATPPPFAPQTRFTMAPVIADYTIRNTIVSFYERRVKADPTDQISLNALSAAYMQRYRETGDIGDVLRAEAAARASLAAMPRHNLPANYALSSALLTFHRFREALAVLPSDIPGGGESQNALYAKQAGLFMELGDYAAAAKTLDRVRAGSRPNSAVETARSRYAELTGNLVDARRLLTLAQQQADSVVDGSAEGRAWFHERLGELAFHAGDNAQAIAEEQLALKIFPHFALAHNAYAKFALAQGDARTAFTQAEAGAEVVPLPETLGYEADAAQKLGRTAQANALRDEIFTIEKLGNTYRTSDRLLAVYYAEHGLRPEDALTIAQRDVQVRGNEIYAQDTLAWAAAMAGQWDRARTAMALATRYHTEDSLLDYHEGVIEAHFGLRSRARTSFMRALARNPHFHPVYAAVARRSLRAL